MASDSEEENSRLQHQHELKPIILRKFYHSFDELTSSAVHHHRPTGVRCGALLDTTNSSDIEFTIEDRAKLCGIIWPWNSYYQVWWVLTVFGAIVTMMLAPFQVAFECEFNRSFSALESVLNLLFTADIIVNFNLAVSRDEIILTEREQIAKEYFRGKLWVDVLGVSPFERIALLSCAKLFGHSSGGIRLRLAPLRLLQIVRFHRIKKFSHDLRYDARVSLLTFTLIRNFAVVVISCHCQACTMYYLAHLHNFDEGTWLGPIVHDSESIFECYITALYLSITTFCTVGYGDFSPANLEEKVAGSLFMVLNIAIAAWIIGSITLLILKGDETTSEYRDSLEVLHQYGAMHNFDETLMNRLRQQLRLDFNNREVADEQVLKYFPSAVRRKILRRLYKDSLVNTKIMKGIRLQFVDAFLTSCTVEIFSPGEEIVEKGSILSDLFLLVGGIAETVATPNSGSHVDCFECGEPCNSQYLRASKLEAGDFIGEVGFFTESPQIDSVISVTVCKTLTMSRQAYKILAQDHPGSAGKILQNLLVKVESASAETNLPRTLAELRLGSNYYDSSVYTQPVCCAQNESFTALKDLVTMHVRRTQDDDTTRLLFAASRGDTRIISLMCEHGFDPNNAGTNCTVHDCSSLTMINKSLFIHVCYSFCRL